jgi:hypothetical protein
MHILNMRKKWIAKAKQWALPFFFVTGAFVVLEISLKQLEKEGEVLEKQWLDLKMELKSVEIQNEYLTRQINSQSDPAWIEMVMKKELGLVPEGQVKIYFPPIH